MADLLKILRSYLVLGVLVILCITAYRIGTSYRWKTVPEQDGLMAPLLKPGAMFRLDCRDTGLPLARGVVVAYLKDAKDPDAFLLGRIVGLPGERVAVSGGAVLVNGAPLSEPGMASPTRGRVSEMIVPRDHYFVLVDERSDSRFEYDGDLPVDSRALGPVSACRILGRLAR